MDEPQDWLVVDRCVSLLRQSLRKFFPSPGVLESLGSMVAEAAAQVAPDSDLRARLAYLDTVLAQLKVSPPPRPRAPAPPAPAPPRPPQIDDQYRAFCRHIGEPLAEAPEDPDALPPHLTPRLRHGSHFASDRLNGGSPTDSAEAAGGRRFERLSLPERPGAGESPASSRAPGWDAPDAASTPEAGGTVLRHAGVSGSESFPTDGGPPPPSRHAAPASDVPAPGAAPHAPPRSALRAGSASPGAGGPAADAPGAGRARAHPLPRNVFHWRWGLEGAASPAAAAAAPSGSPPGAAPGSARLSPDHERASALGAGPPVGRAASVVPIPPARGPDRSRAGSVGAGSFGPGTGPLGTSPEGGGAGAFAAAAGRTTSAVSGMSSAGGRGSLDSPRDALRAPKDYAPGVVGGGGGGGGGGAGAGGAGGPGAGPGAPAGPEGLESEATAGHVSAVVKRMKKEAGEGARVTRRAQAMFSREAYRDQAPLAIPTSAEVSAILEAVCGPEAVGLPGKGAEGPRGAAGDAGLQVPMSLLAKLVIDMWLRLGPEASAPLLLVLLRRCLASPGERQRARAFDVLVNLAVHGLLVDPPGEGEGEAGDGSGGGGGRGSERAASGGAAGGAKQHRLARASVPSARALGAGAAPEGGAAAGGGRPPGGGLTAAFQAWLRPALFDCMDQLARAGERSPEVWTSALGCLSLMCTSGGAFCRAKSDGVPLSALALLVRVADQQAWSPALRNELLRLSLWLLFVGEGGDGDGGGGDPAARARHVRLDPRRLADFGGVPAVVELYRWELDAEVRQSLFAVLLDVAVGRVAARARDSGLEHPAATAHVPPAALHAWAATALFECDADFPGLLRPYAVVGRPGFAIAFSGLLLGAPPGAPPGAGPDGPGLLSGMEAVPGSALAAAAQRLSLACPPGAAPETLARAKGSLLRLLLQELEQACRANTDPARESRETQAHMRATVASVKEPHGARGTVEAWIALDDLLTALGEGDPGGSPPASALSSGGGPFATALRWAQALLQAAADRKLVPLLEGFQATIGRAGEGDAAARRRRALRKGVLPLPLEPGAPAPAHDDCDMRLRTCLIIPLLERCAGLGPLGLQLAVEGLEVYQRAFLPLHRQPGAVPLPGDLASGEARRKGARVLVHGLAWLLEYSHLDGARPAILRAVRVLVGTLAERHLEDAAASMEGGEGSLSGPAGRGAVKHALSASAGDLLLRGGAGSPAGPGSAGPLPNSGSLGHLRHPSRGAPPGAPRASSSEEGPGDPAERGSGVFAALKEPRGGWGALLGAELADVPRDVWQAVAADLDEGLVRRLAAYLEAESTLFATAAPGARGLLACPRQARDPSALPWTPWASAVEDTRLLLLMLLLARMDRRAALWEGERLPGVRELKGLLSDADPRVRYYAAEFLWKRMLGSRSREYQEAFGRVVTLAQQRGDAKLLDNPYLIIMAIGHTSDII